MNELLRSHVTRVGFDLTLGKTHIAALVWVDFAIKNDRGGDWRNENQRPRSISGRPWNNFIGGVHGLVDRGLVVHTPSHAITLPRGVKYSSELPFRRFYRITPAGRLVIGLLKEAGLWEEYSRALPAPSLRVAS